MPKAVGHDLPEQAEGRVTEVTTTKTIEQNLCTMLSEEATRKGLLAGSWRVNVGHIGLGEPEGPWGKFTLRRL